MTQNDDLDDPYLYMKNRVKVRLEVENYQGNRLRTVSQEVVSDEQLHQVGLGMIVDDLVRQIRRELEKH